MTVRSFLIAAACELIEDVSVSSVFHGGVVAARVKAFLASSTLALSVELVVETALL